MESTRSGSVAAVIVSSGLFLILVLPQGAAQTRFSANVVGYADANLYAGSNLVANPFDAGDNTVSNLFRGLPSGSFFLPWNSTTQSFGPTNHFSSTTGWTDGSVSLRRPHGGFLWLTESLQISFVGEPWSPTCVTFLPGQSVSGVLPVYLCGFCTSLEGCPLPLPDYTSIIRWDRQNQRFITCEYTIDLGWLPPLPTLSPDEAAVIYSPFLLNAFAPGYYSPAATRLHNPRRTGMDFTFQFPSSFEVNYEVQLSSDPASNPWRTILSEKGRPTDGLITVSLPVGDDPVAFYRVDTLRLRNPSRSDGQFRFQFYAEQGIAYAVSRSPSLVNASWQPVTTISGTGSLVTAIDNSATHTTAYYRVQY